MTNLKYREHKGRAENARALYGQSVSPSRLAYRALRRYPIRGEPVVHVGDGGLRVNGFKPDRDPVTQASRYVDALNGLLPKLTTWKIEAKGIVAFPSYMGGLLASSLQVVD